MYTFRSGLKFTSYSKNLKQNLEIRQIHKGHLVFVAVGNGNAVRHPIIMSDFEERPRFYQSKGRDEKIGEVYHNLDKTDIPKENLNRYRLLIDLLRLIPNYSEKNCFRMKKQLLKSKRKGHRKQ